MTYFYRLPMFLLGRQTKGPPGITSALQENLSSAGVWSLRLSIDIRVAKRPTCFGSEPSILCRKDSQGAPGALAGEALF
jgi:hypothetical protein